MEKNQTHCSAGHRAANTENGVICYTGTIIGSQAHTICNENNQKDSSIDGALNSKECQTNGMWTDDDENTTDNNCNAL